MRASLALIAPAIAALLSIAFFTPAAAEPFSPGQSLDQALVAQVTGVALSFIEPRTLEAIPIPQLTVWGLRGLTTLDSKYIVDSRDGIVSLLARGKPIVVRAAPADNDIDGWAALVAQLTRVAWDGSEPVRHVGTEGIIRTFFDELFNHFDAYSRYTSPDEADADRLRRNGRISAGITPVMSRDNVVVDAVAPDSPAAKRGVRAGETILAIDGQSVEGEDAAFVSALLDGPDGDALSLTLRGPDRRVRTVAIVRKTVVPETVRASRAADLLVIRIGGFASDTGDRLGRELSHGVGVSRPPRGIVLDLRGNRGGLLSQAVSAAKTLLASGPIVSTEGRDLEADHQFASDGQDLGRGLPVVVIVDGRSASSAEILAAALADDGRAVVVGSSTLGKGVVQTVTTLPDGGELFVTWSRVLAPLEWPIQGLGVLPQVCTSLGEAQLNEQLQGLNEGRQDMARALLRHRSARAPMPPAEMLEIRGACPAAEGRDSDMDAARYLIAHRTAYETALISSAPSVDRLQVGPERSP